MAKFYLDEDVTRLITTDLRALGHDAASTDELGRKGQTDPKQLWFAATERRILVTCNRRDLVLLHEAWVVWQMPGGGTRPTHEGLLVIPNAGGALASAHADSIHRLLERDTDLRNRLLLLQPDGRWSEWQEPD